MNNEQELGNINTFAISSNALPSKIKHPAALSDVNRLEA